MNDSWDNMKKAKEDLYFSRQNEEALKKIKAERAGSGRKSPITGEIMEEVAYKGVVLDRCKTSGGIWLDSGELEKIIETVLKEKDGDRDNWLSNFLGFLGNKGNN